MLWNFLFHKLSKANSGLILIGIIMTFVESDNRGKMGNLLWISSLGSAPTQDQQSHP